MDTKMSTLCYIENKGRYLMLHRIKKEKDINRDKWIGVGGHFEAGESPEECILRETQEETGYTLTKYQFRGIITFCYGDSVTEYMHLFTATQFTGTPIPCDEGVLEWVPLEDIPKLELWEGDRIFLRLLQSSGTFFSLKLEYEIDDRLKRVLLDGEELDFVKVLSEESPNLIQGRSGDHEYFGAE